MSEDCVSVSSPYYINVLVLLLKTSLDKRHVAQDHLPVS